MPISNARHRAEIGYFYNALHRHFVYPKSDKALVIFMNLIKGDTLPSTCHIFSFLILFFLFPAIFFCAISIKDSVNVTKCFRLSFIRIYFCIRITCKLLNCALDYRKTFVNFLTQYILFLQVFTFFPHLRILLILCGDVELNPGPEKLQNLSLCHWNLNGIAAHNYAKISLLEAYIAVHDFDIIFLSETFLDSDHLRDDPRLQLEGYVMRRSDHSSNSKRGGVCIYYKEHLPFVRRDDLECLNECIVGEIRTKGSKCFVTCLYRSPSQTATEMNDFLSGFEQICSDISLESPNCSIVIGDLNAKSKNWWPDGGDNTCGIELFALSTSFGYSQLIKEPTNFESTGSSCIDLIFANQANLVVESGVHPSLCKQCHHQIIYAKLSFKIFLPPTYEREVWHYSRARIDLIRRSIEMFDWTGTFRNMHCINDKVDLFNNVLANIFSNFIPHETVKCSYRDPPWMTQEIKKVLRKKNRLYKKYIASGKNNFANELSHLSDLVSDLIDKTKSKYFSDLGKRMNDPLTAPKTYWSLLRRLMNKVKIPVIPPLLINGIFETDFEKKAGVFNSFFAEQCNIVENGSTLPAFAFKTEKRLNSVSFSSSDILRIIKGLNPNKAHGHENISVKMIKLCGDSIIHPLKLLFETAIEMGHFPNSWKKGNIVPVHKKESKNLVKNYRPISLLPIFGKIFEKILYDNLYRYLQQNKLLNENQSGFRKGDSCVSQLLAITHEIYKSFDGSSSLDTRGVFLDISKAFDKVWHEGLLFKLKSYGVEESFYEIIKDYLQNRKQRVVLCGQSSSWLDVNAGVPQGSVLGPLLFLIYINDLPDNLICLPKLFADDTSIFSTVYEVNESGCNLNKDLATVKQWAYQWKMSFNPDPNKQATEVIFSHKKIPVNHPVLFFNDSPIVSSSVHKHLGLVLDEKLTFDHHINEKIAKAYKGVALIKRLYTILPRKSLLCIYTSFVRPHLDYADVIYDRPHNDRFCEKIESVQYNAALAITGTFKGTSRDRLYQELGLESLTQRRWYRRLLMFFKIVSKTSQEYLHKLLPPQQVSYNPQKNGLFRNFRANSDYFQNSFFPYSVDAWNHLGESLRNSPSIYSFKKSLLAFVRPRKSHVFNIHDPHGLKLLTRLRVNFSQLREHKFRHNFRDTINPLCSCGLAIESTKHYLLRCSFFSSERKTLVDKVADVIGDISHLSDDKLIDLLLYGSDSLTTEQNACVLRYTIVFLKSSGRFDIPLL